MLLNTLRRSEGRDHSTFEWECDGQHGDAGYRPGGAPPPLCRTDHLPGVARPPAKKETHEPPPFQQRELDTRGAPARNGVTCPTGIEPHTEGSPPAGPP